MWPLVSKTEIFQCGTEIFQFFLSFWKKWRKISVWDWNISVQKKYSVTLKKFSSENNEKIQSDTEIFQFDGESNWKISVYNLQPGTENFHYLESWKISVWDWKISVDFWTEIFQFGERVNNNLILFVNRKNW